jgi:hypothetical protein
MIHGDVSRELGWLTTLMGLALDSPTLSLVLPVHLLLSLLKCKLLSDE